MPGRTTQRGLPATATSRQSSPPERPRGEGRRYGASSQDVDASAVHLFRAEMRNVVDFRVLERFRRHAIANDDDFQAATRLLHGMRQPAARIIPIEKDADCR